MKRIFKVFSVVAVLVGISGFLGGCKNQEKPLVNSNEKLKTLKVANSEEDYIKLYTYFDASKDENKPEVIKEERVIKKEELLGELIMQEIIKGPSKKSSLKPILSKETKLLSFSINDKIAYVNLSKNAKHKMTASREKACLQGIVLSLTQLKSIDKVKILIDNENIDSLGDNYDISRPFGDKDIDNMKK